MVVVVLVVGSRVVPISAVVAEGDEMDIRATFRGTSMKFLPDMNLSCASPGTVPLSARSLICRVVPKGGPIRTLTPETGLLFLTIAHEATWSRFDPLSFKINSGPPGTMTAGFGDAEDKAGAASAAKEQAI